jgi:hypothetical protein
MPSSPGRHDRPTCAHDAGWGDRRLWSTLFDNRQMRVCSRKRYDRPWPTGGWRSHARRDSRVGASFVRRAIPDQWRRRSGAVAQWERTRLSIGGLRVRVPSVPLFLQYGFCSSPVERLVEAQRAAGSIPAEAMAPDTPPWRNGRRATLRTSWARPMGVQVPPAALRCRVAQRESGGLISRVRRGFESRPCNLLL